MSDTEDIAAQVDTSKPLSTKPVKSWKQNKSTTPNTNTTNNTEPTAEELQEIHARKAAEQERINQINMQQANDLLGGFTIQRDTPKPSVQHSNSNDNNIVSQRNVNDTISDYPLSKDEDYDQFASKIADKLLINKSNVSTVLHSQRLLRFCKTVCKKLCDDKSMRLDEVNLLKSYLSVLHSDKTKNQPRKQHTKPIAQNSSINKLPAKVQAAVTNKQNSAVRNLYQDEDAEYDYDDTYDNNEDFM